MSGGGGAVLSSRTQTTGRRQHPVASLPLDILLQIAARTDPITLVRCAATCRDVRRRAADDPAFFRRCLRLRHAADRFVPPLLRGHIKQGRDKLFLVDATAASESDDGGSPITISSHDGGEFLGWPLALASRDGLLLVHTTGPPPGRAGQLHVCDPVTGRSQAMPPEPSFPAHVDSHRRWGYEEVGEVHYVLLVGDDGGCSSDAVGRPFQVLKANIVLAKHGRYLQMHIFSSEHGAWGPYTKIRTPQLHGGFRTYRGRCRPLAVDDNTVYWLCLTDTASYVLKIKPRASVVTVTTLPASFPSTIRHSYLLATTAAGGTPVLLVADNQKITAWAQAKRTAKWAKEPQVVVECEAILQLLQYQDGGRQSILADQNLHVHLMWFAQRSGVVLVTIDARGSFWMDLRSMKIVRSSRALNGDANYPYEMDLASWVPTFSSAF